MKLFKTIYYIFIAFIGAIAILLIFSVFPITGNYKLMIVKSGSMTPAIKIGSIVVIKPMDEYKIGDVISFGETTKIEAPTTHRIYDIKVTEGKVSYITKGDANNAPDRKEISQIEVIGKVLFSVPFVGYAVDFTKKPLGFALIIIAPGAIIIYGEVGKIYQEIKKMKEKRKSQ